MMNRLDKLWSSLILPTPLKPLQLKTSVYKLAIHVISIYAVLWSNEDKNVKKDTVRVLGERSFTTSQIPFPIDLKKDTKG